MREAALRAFGNVRVRARKARLHGPALAARLRGATPAARAALLRDLGAPGGDAAALRRAELGRLMDDYAVLAAAYGSARGLITAMARVHEIENLKLVWRACLRDLPAERWLPLWRPLGRLESLRAADCRLARTLRDLADCAAATPYRDVVAEAVAAQADLPAAAELRFDAFTSRALVDAARALPAADAAAREFVLDRVRERDLDALRRAAALGLAPELAPGAVALLGGEAGGEALRALAAWTPALGPLGPLVPRSVSPPTAAADWPALLLGLRRRRRRACARAFLAGPFRLAPAIALLACGEEQLRALTALAEAEGGAPAEFLAGCAMGD